MDSGDKSLSIMSDFSFDDVNSSLAKNSEYLPDFISSAQNVQKILSSMIENLEAAVNVLSVQYDIISDEIVKQTRVSYLVTSGLIILSLLAAVFLALKISRKIVISIKSIEGNISLMARGDLTKNFNILSKDEIGFLSQFMNTFQTELRNTIKIMKELSGKSSEMKGDLIATSTETSASAEQIAATLESINKQMKDLDENISFSSNDVIEISTLVKDLNNHIYEKLSMVEESTASVTEMIASIQSVSQRTEKNAFTINELINTIEDGGRNVNETKNIIEEINSSVNEIYNMVDIIQKISSQTNLLAMNASIDAKMKNVIGISANIVNAVSEINIGFNEVRGAVSGLKEISDRVGMVSDKIDREVNRFITIEDSTLEVEELF